MRSKGHAARLIQHVRTKEHQHCLALVRKEQKESKAKEKTQAMAKQKDKATAKGKAKTKANQRLRQRKSSGEKGGNNVDGKEVRGKRKRET